jgi:acyl-CoA thioester hydrolase
MPRISIDLPDKFIFTTLVPIRIGDINRGAHVSNVNLLSIVEESRAQFLINQGYADEVNIVKGIGFIVGDIGIIYKKQIAYGKQIKIEIGCADFKNKSFDMVFKLSDNTTNEEIARAKTGLLLFDYQLQQVITVPEEMRRKFQGVNVQS